MSKVLTYKIKYFKRQITNDGSGLVTFFLDAQPDFLPAVGQKLLISHTDLPSGDSGIRSKIEDLSTNVVTGTFNEFIQDTENTALNDNYSNMIVIKYDDSDFANNSGAGTCRGFITFEVDTQVYEVLKPVESSTIVTDTVAYDGGDGANTLVGSTTGNTQSREDIMPMVFVDRGDANTIFANFFSTFNLPVTAEEKKDFTQSSLGRLVESTTGEFLINGKNYNWVEDLDGTVVHPTTGYTGTFFGTAFQSLNVDEVLVIEVPENQYGEIIDGKSIKIQLPSTGATETTYTIYSAFCKNTEKLNNGGLDKFNSETNLAASYFGNEPDLDGDLTTYESNIALLFSDDIKKPLGDANKTWSDGWTEVISGDKVYSKNVTQPKEFFDYNEDQSVGIAYLDKGMLVITDPTIVEGVKGVYTSVSGSAQNIITTAGSASESQFLIDTSFSGTTPQTDFLSYNSEKSLNVICLAAGDEFFRTTNETAKELTSEEDKNFADFKNGSDTQYPVEITDVGLYDDEGNLLAICVPNEPIKKQWFDLSVMKIKIKL